MSVNCAFECFTLEDQRQVKKVKGETRIPDGKYQVKLRKVLSPLTEHYRDKYRWFKWHLELQDVPNFQHVYIHIGNTEKDTDACILVADQSYSDPNDYSSTIGKSTQAFKRFYEIAYKTLERAEEDVFLEVKSIWL